MDNLNYYEYLKYSLELENRFPFITREVVGKSVMGKDILSFTLGVASEYVLIVGGIKGTEHKTSNILTSFLEELALSLAKDTAIEGLRTRRAMLGRAVVIIPSLNPDSCEIARFGKKASGNMESTVRRLCKDDFSALDVNVRGVDLENDFALHKEPESEALRSVLGSLPIRHLVMLGEGENEFISPKSIPRRNNMADIISASSGFREKCGESPMLNGFSALFSKPAFKISAKSEEGYSHRLRELLMLLTIM